MTSTTCMQPTKVQTHALSSGVATVSPSSYEARYRLVNDGSSRSKILGGGALL